MPRRGELLYVPTQLVVSYWLRGNGSRKCSGRLTGYGWEFETGPIDEFPKIRFCIDHWCNGMSWEQTGAYHRMMEIIGQKGELDGCRTYEDVVARYARLDRIFEQVRKDGRLKSQRELLGTHTEKNGILFHIDRHGDPIFGLGGNHRLSMALALGLPEIPALLGMTHPQGIQYLHQYRRNDRG